MRSERRNLNVNIPYIPGVPISLGLPSHQFMAHWLRAYALACAARFILLHIRSSSLGPFHPWVTHLGAIALPVMRSSTQLMTTSTLCLHVLVQRKFLLLHATQASAPV